eukprot:14698412-Alexandrium_andersonii.AAC.1
MQFRGLTQRPIALHVDRSLGGLQGNGKLEALIELHPLAARRAGEGLRLICVLELHVGGLAQLA